MRPTLDDVGTRYYHSHVGLQAMSAYGAFIVEDEDPPFAYDEERLLLVGDWYNKTEQNMTAGLLAAPFVWPGSAVRVVVNGLAFTGQDQQGEVPYIIDVDFDKTYLLRWLGAQGTMYYAIQIFNHTMILVEADGTYLQPHSVEVVELGAGQRYGALLHSKPHSQVVADHTDGCYWVRLEAQWRKPATRGWAVLRYPGGCQGGFIPPTSKNSESLISPAMNGWISGDLEPLLRRIRRPMPDDTRVIRRQVIRVQQTARSTNSTSDVWRDNGDVYNETTTTDTPYLIQLFLSSTPQPSYERAMDNRTQVGWDETTKTFVARQGEVLDIVIINQASLLSHQVEIHPMHFHSSRSWHLASGTGNFSDEALAEVRKTGYRRPVPRDTIMLWPGPGSSLDAQDKLPSDDSAGGWTVLRYEVQRGEAGVWPLHCHILFHQVMGMSSSFALNPREISVSASRRTLDPAYFVFNSSVKSPTTYSQGHAKGC